MGGDDASEHKKSRFQQTYDDTDGISKSLADGGGQPRSAPIRCSREPAVADERAGIVVGPGHQPGSGWRWAGARLQVHMQERLTLKDLEKQQTSVGAILPVDYCLHEVSASQEHQLISLKAKEVATNKPPMYRL